MEKTVKGKKARAAEARKQERRRAAQRRLEYAVAGCGGVEALRRRLLGGRAGF